MDKKNDDKGSLTLETCLVLPLFMFLFLFIYGLFAVFSAQNQITHALVQSTKSLSLDSYLTENSETILDSDTDFWDGLSDLGLDIWRTNTSEWYTSRTNWFDSETGDASIARMRFVGYLVGEGSSDDADSKLRGLGVVNGLDGMNFSMSISGENMTVTITYNLRFTFDFFGAGIIPMEQSITCRLWKS